METIRCPYCESKVRVSDVDADDGACPECGAPLTGSLLFDPEDMESRVDDHGGDSGYDDLDDN